MLRASVVAILLCMFAVVPGSSSPAPSLKGRGVWTSPRDAGLTEASIVAFLSQLDKARVDFDEEREPLVRVREFADGKGAVDEAKRQFALVAEPLRQCAPALHDQIRFSLDSPSGSASPSRSIGDFLAAPPAGYLPEGKLIRAVDRVRAEGAEAVVIFSAGGIARAHLWEAVGGLFARD